MDLQDVVGSQPASPAGYHRVGDLCTIRLGLPEADFWLLRRGTAATVGRPVRSFRPEHIGLKVERTDLLVPNYLFQFLSLLHQEGVLAELAGGTTQLRSLRSQDVRHIPVLRRAA